MILLGNNEKKFKSFKRIRLEKNLPIVLIPARFSYSFKKYTYCFLADFAISP